MSDKSDVSEQQIGPPPPFPVSKQVVTELEEAEGPFASHPLLKKFWPSERRAIRAHHFSLSLELKREASVRETLKSWESGICMPWRRRKMCQDGQEQLRQIERHKYLVSERLGYDVGWEAAAKEWIDHHAGPWREWWEAQPESGG